MGIYRRYCKVCWYGGRCWRFALVGSFASATNWGGVIGAGLLALGFQQYGQKLMPADRWYEIVAQGLLFIVAAWVVIFLFRLVFIAPFVIHREGEWHGHRFVYRQMKLGFHLYASPSKNNETFKFKFRDAPPFSLISYKIELDGRSDFISLLVASNPSQLPTFTSEQEFQYTGGSIAVDRERNMCLRIFMRPDADAFSVRIWVRGFEIVAVGSKVEDTIEKQFEPARWD